MLKVRNKNAILELLNAGSRFERMVVAENLDEDSLTKEILALAGKKGIRIDRAPRYQIDKRRGGESREVLLGYLIPEPFWTLKQLLDDLEKKKKEPFFLLLNRVDFENNIGIIARTAFAAGVNGLIFQGPEDRFLNEETVHFSLGAITRVPLVRTNIFEALRQLNDYNVRTFSVQMNGESVFKQDLSGPVAFVFGAESKGISDPVSNRCQQKISIPMRSGIDSLNVGVSAGIILYQKVFQDLSK